jgi:hypothetical protein
MGYRAVVPAVLALGMLLGATFQAKTAKEIMTAANKGDDSLFKKVSSGKGTDDDIKKLVEYYDALAAIAKPPMGDEAGWKTKTAALAAAAHEVAEKKAGAVEKLTKAGDCKACHSVHKPKK